tara:strand:+ start:9523 stop:10566 length:1044 start_codon:yes stop_codon:yes gene_type:complete
MKIMKNYYFNTNLEFSIFNQKKREKLTSNQVRISMKNCGICGSDIHYFLYGENGGRKIKEPLILGHEAVGEILEVGNNTKHLKVTDRVAINPALYCNNCIYCKSRKFHLCENVLFFGSASKIPHTQGAFREEIIVDKNQCYLLDTNTSFEEAAFSEPFAVALHASKFVNYKQNQKILISGCGPIGLLILKVLICMIEEKNIYVIDINDNVLRSAKKIGNINTININDNISFIKDHSNFFDICFESSGNTKSINNLVDLGKRGSDIIQVGNMPGGLIEINYNKVMIKELKIQGSYRFSSEFEEAVKKINKKEYNFQDILTHKFKLENCEEALKIASDKDKSIKVQVYN